jgi:hypothetical protein
MPNNQPIFSRIGDIQWSGASASAANTTKDLTTGITYSVFVADSTNGGYVQRIRFRPLGTNQATVARLWINNGSSTGTAANNVLFDEVSLAATTVSETSALSTTELPLNFALPPSYRLFVTLGVTASAGYAVSVIGGKY